MNSILGIIVAIVLVLSSHLQLLAAAVDEGAGATDVALDVVELLPLRRHQHGHVVEHLVDLEQAALQVGNGAVALLDLGDDAQHLAQMVVYPLSTEQEMNLFSWHIANLEYANAGLLSKLSLAFWGQESRMIHMKWALAENVPIVYERTVHTVRYGGDEVQVVVNGGQVNEGMKGTWFCALFHLEFSKMGASNLYLSCHRGNLMNQVDVESSLLMALVAGEAAHNFETTPPTDAISSVLKILR
ncbi:hypothetical protein GUJ93_ZPchr0004g38773 [Zizania palustris]|uniref:Uncharacterized protein n=1 Tax=Zizania palustris TaxID=103762 RepID=A0A8J5VP69_ZIZPA|nr:hypothetical protein GUJ93_ZPchr0004g38773 [Zizania palustris]